jgi:hypothetical protein
MSKLEKACLIELDPNDLSREKAGSQKVLVQFNPETLKVTFANQLAQQQASDQSSGPGGRQYVGKGTTKLSLTLWFDVTALIEKPVDDVRRLTAPVVYFMTPQPSAGDKDKLVPPALRFSWGKFLFDGVVDSLEESLEFFSPDGRALRASIALAVSQQKILTGKAATRGKVGTRPLDVARAGDTLQAMAGAAGGGRWQAVAAANGIEDPLRLRPGQLIDLAKTAGGGGLGLSAGTGPAGPGSLPPLPTIALPSAATRFGVN